MASGKDHGDGFKCKPSVVWYVAMIDELYKEWLVEKAKEFSWK